MFISVLVAIGCLASNVIADGASIVAALDKISDATAQLNNSVISWDGSLLGTLPIIADSTALLADINSATKTAEQSANLTDLEALGVGLATLSLASDVNTTLATIEAAKPKFQRLLLAPLILLNLELVSKFIRNPIISNVGTPYETPGESIQSEVTSSIFVASEDAIELLLLTVYDQEKGATDQFSAAVLQKVPAALQSTAEGITSGIDDAFDQAINDYNLLSDL